MMAAVESEAAKFSMLWFSDLSAAPSRDVAVAEGAVVDDMVSPLSGQGDVVGARIAGYGAPLFRVPWPWTNFREQPRLMAVASVGGAVSAGQVVNRYIANGMRRSGRLKESTMNRR